MTTSRRHLVVGSGSIAKRHIANLKRLFPGSEIGCLSSSGRALSTAEVRADVIFGSMDEAVGSQPEFAIVASPAPFHLRDALPIARAGIPVLIEKPVSSSLAVFRELATELGAYRDKIAIGYNLRFMASAIKFRELIAAQRVGHVHSVQVEVGQYLPDWRPGRDYRRGVSARADLGGGALLELSHELDYLTWIFGQFETVYCIAERSETLGLDVEDNVSAVLGRSGGPTVSLRMDFLQRDPNRGCKVIGEQGTLVWNILTNTITFADGPGEPMVLFSDRDYDRNQMYLAELEAFSEVARGRARPLVGLDDGACVLYLIDALRNSSETGQAVRIAEFAT